MQGLYVHIPFCVKKCSYCDFYSLPSRLDSIEAYVQAIIKEAVFYRNDILSPVAAEMNVAHGDSSGTSYLQKDNNLFQTLYIGGGTPSLLGAKHLKSLIDGLNKEIGHPHSLLVTLRDKSYLSPQGRGDSLSTFIEATIEVNPESATQEFLTAANDCGINRVSFGMQSLSDNELRSVGRIHTAAQAIEAIKLAKKLDFKSISADLIIGLPGQTWFTLQRSLETLISLGIEHLSVYCLSLEEGTPLAKSPPDNLPSDDMQAELYEDTRSFLAAAGFIHYEISNFALKGCECQHNLNYWRGGEYVGLGTAAASHLNGKRFRNKANLDAYLENPTGQIEYDEILSLKDKAAEEAMLRLRLVNEGLDIVELSKKYGDKNVAKLRKRLDSMAHEGSLISEGSRYRLASSRILTSNQIFARVLKE
jgi:oxygen-independent coproporphyrinogen-3 oxidase